MDALMRQPSPPSSTDTATRAAMDLWRYWRARCTDEQMESMERRERAAAEVLRRWQ